MKLNKIKMRRIKLHKKGFYFLLDAILASILLVAGLLALSQYSSNYKETARQDYVGKDVLITLSTLTIEDFNEFNSNNSFIVSEIKNGNITYTDNSILEQVGEYWARNETGKASQLISEVLGNSLDSYNIELAVLNAYRTDFDTVYFNNATGGNDLIASRRMVSGIEKGQPLEGSTSTAYLRRLDDKRTYSYIYFGGYVGQGNITVIIKDFPSDFDSSKIIDVSMEADSGTDFNIFINKNFCSRLNASLNNMSSDRWDITGCSNLFVYGQNNLTISFIGNFNLSYIAGGYIKVGYLTDTMNNINSQGTLKYYFPDINGVINLYDSFYIPGTLNSMNVYLNFYNNQTTYMTIGDTEVFDKIGNTTNQSYVITDNELKNFPYFIDYGALSNKTIPLRISGLNTTSQFSNQSGNADVVLITDLSGSMIDRIGYWAGTPDGTIRICNDTHLYDNDTRRVSLAKCFDKNFIDIVMNYSGNRLWLVDFSTNAQFYYNNNKLNLISRVNNYSNAPSGGTCIACSINLATSLLQNYSNSSRNKFVILMTDGIPSYCSGRYMQGGSWRCNTTSIGTTGLFNPTECAGDSSDCNNNDCQGPANNSIFAANRTKILTDAKIYSIGMGPVYSCNIANSTLSSIAKIGNGTYFGSQNASELKKIYDQIATEITSASQYAQTITVKGNFSASKLFGSSYIEINYTPEVISYGLNEIEAVSQSQNYNICNFSINFPPNVRIMDAKIISYSGEHWSDLLIVNNNVVFDLSSYGNSYVRFGDPFSIHIPVNYLYTNQPNRIYLRTADAPNNFTGCSNNISLIYSFVVNSTTSRSNVLKSAVGCIWNIEFEDGTSSTTAIPKIYTGSNICSFTSSLVHYNANDSYDSSVYEILSQLDFDNNNKVDVNLNTEDLEVIVTTISAVPYFWGPSIIEARVWK